MFKLDMDAIRKNAKQPFLPASTANVANLLTAEPENPVFISKLAALATLADKNSEIEGVSISKLATLATPTYQNSKIDQSLITARLTAKAMQICDKHGDGPEAREAMRRDILETPEHLKAELLEHLLPARHPVKAASAPRPPSPSVARPTTKPIKHVDQDWRPLALAYYDHHAKCVVCITAGKGTRYGLRCGVGAALWTGYQNAI